MTTPLKSQLTGFTGMYLGMLVVVTSDTTDSNNGLYRLKDVALRIVVITLLSEIRRLVVIH